MGYTGHSFVFATGQYTPYFNSIKPGLSEVACSIPGQVGSQVIGE